MKSLKYIKSKFMKHKTDILFYVWFFASLVAIIVSLPFGGNIYLMTGGFIGLLLWILVITGLIDDLKDRIKEIREDYRNFEEQTEDNEIDR